MSASNKKKLRKEQEAAKLTEKQLTARQEAKKTNLYTIGFVVVMVALLLTAVIIGTTQTINNSGIREKNTVAVTIGDHKISNAELNYFYIDAVNNFYQNYGSYASMFGLDVSLPLNQQVSNPETGETWADDFLNTAISNAKAAYAIADAAQAAGYTLSTDSQASVKASMEMMDLYGSMYGYTSGEEYLKAMYGKGATLESYQAYMELMTLANEYQTYYVDSLTYDDAALRAAESGNFSAYSSYSFHAYYVTTSRFLEGGTTAADGTTTYTDAEKAASVTAAEAAANALVVPEITSVEDLDAAIAAMEINAENPDAASTLYKNVLYTSVSTIYADWITDSARKAGDMTVVPSTSTTTNADGTETTVTNGYYVLYFLSSTDNTFPLKNVRHILVSFEGGTTDPNTGIISYSDEERAAAKTQADALLAQWEAGEKTEASFAVLATEKTTDTGSAENGGLYEDIYPGQMVETFDAWCYDESRKHGDTGIVESTYGYHIMFFVGDSEVIYRDYMITNELRNADGEAWYNGLVEAMPVTAGNTAYIAKDIVLGGGYA